MEGGREGRGLKDEKVRLKVCLRVLPTSCFLKLDIPAIFPRVGIMSVLQFIILHFKT